MTPPPRRLSATLTLVPLAVLSAAWIINVAGLTPATDTAAPSNDRAGTTPAPELAVPGQPYRVPASVTSSAAPQAGSPPQTTLPAAVSAAAIPPAALAAYQRAATVIDDADQGCHLDWALLAAIGRVESDHGAVGGSSLTPSGIATPGIVGPALTGRGGTTRISDTDGGRYDGDTHFDRAVGPMQFIPSTWATVGVDADADGRRDPQDINDAALAAAVYLCAGSDDLATVAGQRAAVLRYNHSAAYVAIVLQIAADYRAGDHTPAPLDTAPAVSINAAGPSPTTTASPPASSSTRSTDTRSADIGAAHGSRSAPSGPSPVAHNPGSIQTEPAADSPIPSTPASQSAAAEATDPPTETGDGGGTTPDAQPATAEELTALCAQQVATTYPSATTDAAATATEECAEQLTGSTLDAAQSAAPDLVAQLYTSVGGLDGPSTPPPSDPPPPTPPSDQPPADPGPGEAP